MVKKLNVDSLGQVFTENVIVEKMISMIKNKGSILEPSCGDGAFFKNIPNCIGIEYDESVCPENALNMNFFDYSVENSFDTIIGNPPYVKYQSILEDTKEKINLNMFDERTNLYLFFIEKCVRHLNKNGELIFIVPRDFIKATSGINLNKFIYEQGTITDWIDLGDQLIFPGFSPNCVIFRFEKDNFSRKTMKGSKLVNFKESNGQLFFSEYEIEQEFSELFFVKVGAVSGADSYFESENGNMEFVNSKTVETKQTKKMHYNIMHEELVLHKDFLMNRKIKKFNDGNWYNWGRAYYESELPRIYVNGKTRKDNPFFIHECNAYDGSVLAIFPKFKIKDNEHLAKVCAYLNSIDWEDLGFKCDGRFLFSQKSLENSVLNKKFKI